ncbi:PRTRC system protein B [Spirosoma pollinicola]|uniref:PRTRC system protein B n=1 Tax=Spirosoma pollinicola TaxID=2057025 RepID=A0A2K8Z8V4_9BACT|nr:PRTRC system protein B [Spirosoma pollinicola]AUD06302.1 PRTRC system protein B [Spirosoma pollinicola]
MQNITEQFEQGYYPVKALLLYRSKLETRSFYLEAFDIEKKTGKPINAHPLAENKLTMLSKALLTKEKKQQDYLMPKGLLPANLLSLNTQSGVVLWYTPAQEQSLFFKDSLTIPCGKAQVPALVWKASKCELQLFALSDDGKPDIKTPLYYAPFFNTAKSGNVCMGTVQVGITESSSLEEFIGAWETAFFNSYFSHLNDQHQPVKGNIIQLWQSLMDSGKPFPIGLLTTSSLTIQQLL